MAEVADGLTRGTVSTAAAALVERPVPESVPESSLAQGSASGVPRLPSPESGVGRTRLRAPAARARPPAASRTLRGRGRRCRPRGPKSRSGGATDVSSAAPVVSAGAVSSAVAVPADSVVVITNLPDAFTPPVRRGGRTLCAPAGGGSGFRGMSPERGAFPLGSWAAMIGANVVNPR